MSVAVGRWRKLTERTWYKRNLTCNTAVQYLPPAPSHTQNPGVQPIPTLHLAVIKATLPHQYFLSRTFSMFFCCIFNYSYPLSAMFHCYALCLMETRHFSVKFEPKIKNLLTVKNIWQGYSCLNINVFSITLTKNYVVNN